MITPDSEGLYLAAPSHISEPCLLVKLIGTAPFLRVSWMFNTHSGQLTQLMNIIYIQKFNKIDWPANQLLWTVLGERNNEYYDLRDTCVLSVWHNEQDANAEVARLEKEYENNTDYVYDFRIRPIQANTVGVF